MQGHCLQNRAVCRLNVPSFTCDLGRGEPSHSPFILEFCEIVGSAEDAEDAVSGIIGMSLRVAHTKLKPALRIESTGSWYLKDGEIVDKRFDIVSFNSEIRDLR